MKPLTTSEVTNMWYVAKGDFGCILNGERTIYELNDRPVPYFQRSEGFHFFGVVLSRYLEN